DYSSEGNQATRDRFNQTGKEIQIFERDLFGDVSDLPTFDVVFSLGFIEHFDDPLPTIEKHLALVKPGGILLLGVPNLDGIYKKVLRITAPSFEESHNLNVMNLDSWKEFENKLNLKPLFRGYIGGFEPLNMKKLERKTLLSRGLNLIAALLTVTLSFHFSFFRKFNSRYWSGYMIGIYKKS
ncbi:MAG: class I SAM-dependent methyltransferase, partial [Bacteroidota bacterium]